MRDLCAHPKHLPSQQLLKETPVSLSSDPMHVARASPGSCALAAPGPPPAPRPIPFPEGTLVPGAAPCITRINGAGSMAPAGDQKAPEGSWSEGWMLWQSPRALGWERTPQPRSRVSWCQPSSSQRCILIILSLGLRSPISVPSWDWGRCCPLCPGPVSPRIGDSSVPPRCHEWWGLGNARTSLWPWGSVTESPASPKARNSRARHSQGL